jgi:hypothetical protein
VIVLASSFYINGKVKGNFASSPFSINARLKAGFRSEFARTLNVSGKEYPVFSDNGRLSQDQEYLLGRSELVSLVDGNLRDGESIYFTRDEIGVYLTQPIKSNQVSDVIDRVIDLAGKVEIPAEKLNLKLLPLQFHPLIPLIEKWSSPDDSDRNDLLESASESIIRALIEEVGPYLEVIDSYLDSFRERNPTEEGAALGRLAEFALEAKKHLNSDSRSQIR